MYLFYVISAFMVISGYLMTYGESRGEQTEEQSMKSIATYMWIYQQAARDFCADPGTGAYCNTGRRLTVNQVRPYLPPITLSSGRLTSGRFTAVTDGYGNVFTVSEDMMANQSSDIYEKQRAGVSIALREVVPDYVHAGEYSRSNERVANLQGDYRTLRRSNPWGYMRDQAPVIITDW